MYMYIYILEKSNNFFFVYQRKGKNDSVFLDALEARRSVIFYVHTQTYICVRGFNQYYGIRVLRAPSAYDKKHNHNRRSYDATYKYFSSAIHPYETISYIRVYVNIYNAPRIYYTEYRHTR